MTSAGGGADAAGSKELQVRFERFQARFPFRSVHITGCHTALFSSPRWFTRQIREFLG